MSRTTAWVLCSLFLAGCGIVEESVHATEADREGQDPIEVRAVFEGTKVLGDRRLFLAVRSDLISMSRGQRPEAGAEDAASTLGMLYRSLGRPDTEIETAVEPLLERAGEPPLLVVRFTIDEGPEVVVASLLIEGVTLFSIEEELLPLWIQHGSGTLGLGEPLFVQAELEALATTIQTFYRQRGLLGVQVEGPLLQREGNGVRVRYEVREGEVHRFGKFTVPVALATALGEAMPELPEGQVFTTRQMHEILFLIRARLRQRGHPEPVVRILPPEPDADQRLDVVIEGEPGPRARVRSVTITGIDRTDEDYVLSKCTFVAGDWFDGSQLEDAITQLYRTRVFKRVTIEHSPVVDGEVDLTIRLEEDDPRSLEVLAGYGSYERLRGGLTFEDRNLFGQGRILRLAGRASQKSLLGEAGITDQDLFGTDVRGNVRATWFQREHPAFTDEAVSGLGALSRELLPQLDSRIGYEFIERTDVDVDVVDPAAQFGNFSEARLFAEVHNDTRDSVLLPTQGRFASLQLDFSDKGFGSDIEYLRLRWNVSQHFKVTRRTRLTARVSGGILARQQPAVLPLQVRFFNGGENLVRSFREDMLGPQDVNGKPVGGEYRNVFNLEYRVPLLGVLEGALFADAGNIGANSNDYGFDDMSYALGFGLRMILPIGPVRIDAAWNPEEDRLDKEWIVHFSLGYPF